MRFLVSVLSKLEKSSKLESKETENHFGFLGIRDIAQLGRAPALGAGCRRFKSYYPEIQRSNLSVFENLIFSKRSSSNVDGIEFIFYTVNAVSIRNMN